MILSKSVIIDEITKGNIIADSIQHSQIKDQSIDVRLGRYMWIGANPELVDLTEKEEILIMPNTFVLAHTEEFIGTTANSGILPTFKLKSSAGRLGIIHTLAGHGEVGFFNRWAMEFIVAKPVVLKHRVLIGQIYFTRVEGSEGEDYSKQGTYQSTSSLDELKKNWKPESILPPKELKI